MAVADLIYSIAGDSSKFIRALEQADKQLQKSIQGMSAMGKVGAYLTASFTAVGTALGELSRQAMLDMVEIQKSADRTGIATEELSRLAYAASLVGLELEDVSDATFELSLKLGQAAQADQTAIDAFAALGIAVTDANGKIRSTSDVTEEFFQKITQVPDAATRAAKSAAVLGDDVALKMSPLLAQGSQAMQKMGDEAERLGLVMTEEAGRSAMSFNQNLIRLQGAANGIGRYLVQVFSPALTEMTGKLLNGAMETDNLANRQDAAVKTMRVMLQLVRALAFGVEALALTFAQFGAGLVVSVQATVDNLSALGKMMATSFRVAQGNLGGERAAEAFREFGREVAEAETKRNAALLAMQKDRQEAWANFKADMALIDSNAGAAGIGLSAPEQALIDLGISPEDLKAAQSVYESVKTSGEKLKDEIAKIQKLLDKGLISQEAFDKRKKQLEAQFRKMGQGGSKAFAEGLNQNALRMSDYLDGVLGEMSDSAARMGDEAARAMEAMRDRAEQIREETSTPEERIARQTQELRMLYEAQLIDLETHNRAVAKLEKERAELPTGLQDRNREIQQGLRTDVQVIRDEVTRLSNLFILGAIDADTYNAAVKNIAGDEFLTNSEKAQQELDRINYLLSIGAITAEQYDGALGKIFGDDAQKNAEEGLSAIGQTVMFGAKSLADTFQKLFFDPFNVSLGDMVASFAQAITQMLLQRAVSQLGIALFGAPAAGFAEGGYVSGPGTATSDSIPARLSNGEYVMPAKTVSHFGVEFMDAIRAMKPSRPAPVARFADGGYVSQQAPSGGGVRVVNVVDSSMVQDFLTSSAGEQVILNTIRRNRRQVSQAVA